MSEFMMEEDASRRLNLRTWRKLAGHALGYPGALMALAVSGMVIAAVDVLLPLVTGILIDEALEGGFSSRMRVFAFGYGALLVLFSFFVWYFIVAAGRVATGVCFDLREQAFARLQSLSFSYFDVRPVGWLVTRLTSDCQKISGLMPWFLLDLVWGTCTIGGMVLAMFLLDARLAAAVLVIMPFLALTSLIFQTLLLRSSRLVRRTNSQLTASYNECITGVRTTKILARESDALGEFQGLSTDMERYSVRHALQSAIYLPLVVWLGSIGMAVALWQGGIRTVEVGEHQVSLGTLIAFMQYAALCSMPVQELAARFTELQSGQAAAERVQDLLDTEPGIRDAARTVTPEVRTIRRIEFRNVSFSYVEGESVIEDLDLVIGERETIALVGATGGGKSTIVNLAARFYEASSGSVLINGVDAREVPLEWLQSRLGVVLQTPHLFSGTIRENIRYGRLDASDADIERAAREVHAHGFIESMEDGFESEVGEGGARLSTGQRQLISLARALIANPDVFIMDEATSSVDTETERLIQRAIDRVLSDRIAFVIAHRLSTIRNADRILVIDKGRIVESGSHDDLMRRRSRYHDLYTRQFIEDAGRGA